MQFKNPEVFYFLALLFIPIIVHLFQLQKFVKIPFSNVAYLQKIAQQTRRSSRIKKWLILANRLLLFLAILFAFSQPYFSNKKAIERQHNFIYLDNSLSTNTEGIKGNLLKIASQEIIENVSEKDHYSLLTNDNFYEDISKKELKKTLLNIKNTSKKLDLNTVLLKISDKNNIQTKTLNKNILISDFQYNYKKKFTNVTPSFSAIKLHSVKKNNISIDSVFVSNTNANNFTVNVIIKNQGEAKKNIPLAIFNDTTLVSKQSFPIEKDTEKTIQFTIQNQSEFNGKITLTFSDTFPFDNEFFFSLNNTKKLNILVIGSDLNFLSKIYNKEEFNFKNVAPQNVNFNNILKQDLILLSNLKNIPEIIANKLVEFSNKGGSLAIIPNEDSNLNAYNSFFKKLHIGKLQNKIQDTLKITNINFEHPLFKNVFSKQVTNFQYPTVYSHYPILSLSSSKIVSFENNSSFIQQINRKNSTVYWVSSSLQRNNSNFTNSPLIVPVFYNFAKLSFKYPQLYYKIDDENKIDIEVALKKNEILKITDANNSFIPLQQTHQNKVTITTKKQPLKAGIYYVIHKNDTIQKLAFNNPKEESLLNFMDLNELKKTNNNISVFSSIEDVFSEINKKNEVHWLWKWFLALAIVSLCLEILILKFYKP